MRLSVYLAAMVLSVAAILTACNSAEQKKPAVAVSQPATSVPVPSDGVRRVTVQELWELVSRGQAVVVDVRNPGSFAQGHIVGAKLIPHNEILNHLDELPQDKTIVTYCA